jgi:hypothetical protein
LTIPCRSETLAGARADNWRAEGMSIEADTADTAARAEFHPGSLDTGHGPIRSGTWRDEVKARATRLRSEARWMVIRGKILEESRGKPMDVEVFCPLKRVDYLAGKDRVSPREWLSGSQVEDCWRLLRQVEEGLLRVVNDAGVRARAIVAEAKGEKVLGSDHSLVKALREQLGPTSTAKPDDEDVRLAALSVLRASHENSARQHRQMRSFRNQLLGLSAVLVVLAGMVLIAQQYVIDERLVPTPTNAGLGATVTLAFVMFFGCVGALFSAVPSLAQVPETSSPFNMARQQATLKVVTGAWSAVIGLLVVDAGLAAEQPEIASLGGLAVLAAVFGAGQEAVTRFADHKAGDILRSS